MNDQKIENLLNLALSATQREREESLELNVGYNPEDSTWEIIIRYSGDIEQLEQTDIQITPLLNNYAIVILPQSRIDEFVANPEVVYVEQPKRLYFALDQTRAISCVNSVQTGPFNLGGEGIWVACIDSGVDYRHPDLLNPDGTTRIVRLWDQMIQGRPPEGYNIGTEYNADEINRALALDPAQGYEVVPSRDLTGHGTGVIGIAAGNGSSSEGRFRGMAPRSNLIVVKLGHPRTPSFPRTTELMMAVDYVVRLAFSYHMPIAINLSFGTAYGSHTGESLLADYIDSVTPIGRNVFCIGTGNDASAGGHTSGVLVEGQEKVVLLGVGGVEPTLNLQIWKQYEDDVDIIIIHPGGQSIGPIQQTQGLQRMRMLNTELLLYYGEPSPYSMEQEIYIDFLPSESYIDGGQWQIRLIPRRIMNGNYDMWLPGGGVLNADTRFYESNPNTTLTIPSTARRVISVGAYNSRLQSYASFSGRGYTRVTNMIKPTIVAPGVNINTIRVGGGYTMMTGTSFATPFVTGAAALLMEWGITQGNDPYLFGEKVKAYLINGARQLPSAQNYPNSQMGYGALCVRNSIPV